MLARRIIPVLLCRGRQLIKGKNFNSWRTVGHAEQAVRIYQKRNVDELVLLDISATIEGRNPDYEMVAQLSEECFMPLAVGGGVRGINEVKALLRSGADKVIINSAAMEDMNVIAQIADAVGSQAIVVSIDVSGGTVHSRSGSTNTGMSPVSVAKAAQACGAGEILLTSIDREGTLQGYDIDLIREVARVAKVPVIANGGCGNYDHMYWALMAGADAVAAGSMFQFTDNTPIEAARHLSKLNIEVRL